MTTPTVIPPAPHHATADDASGAVLACTERLHCRSNVTVAEQGVRADRVLIIETGWAVRSRRLADGRSQATGLYLPGDLCDPLWLRAAPAQSVTSAGPLRARVFSRQAFRDAIERHSTLARAIWTDIASAHAAAAEWTLALGLKSATERVAHLFCDLYTRLQRRGRAADGKCVFPLSHADIADLTGLSITHVERTLRDLQGVRLIGPLKRRLEILDLERLVRTAAFDPASLDTAPDWRRLLPVPS